MHRFILKNAVSIIWVITSLAHAEPFSAVEQSWIDAHPVVRFSIHEKYAPYLRDSSDPKRVGVFKSLLSKLAECTRQQYIPVWRNSDQEGLRQLNEGKVDFIIDPPQLNKHVLQFGSLSEAIFWGHDAIVTKDSSKLDSLNPKIGYFDRGLENAPSDNSGANSGGNSPGSLIQSLIKSDIEALVMPIRLARQLIQESQNVDLKIDGLYSRDPFAYRWLISDHHIPPTQRT